MILCIPLNKAQGSWQLPPSTSWARLLSSVAIRIPLNILEIFQNNDCRGVCTDNLVGFADSISTYASLRLSVPIFTLEAQIY